MEMNQTISHFEISQISMIENEQQYQITKIWIDQFEKTLAELDSNQSNYDPILWKAERDGLESQIEDLQKQIREYEDKNTNKPKGLDTCLDIPKKYSVQIYNEGKCQVDDSELEDIFAWISVGGPQVEAIKIALNILRDRKYSYIAGRVNLSTGDMVIQWSEK